VIYDILECKTLARHIGLIDLISKLHTDNDLEAVIGAPGGLRGNIQFVLFLLGDGHSELGWGKLLETQLRLKGELGGDLKGEGV